MVTKNLHLIPNAVALALLAGCASRTARFPLSPPSNSASNEYIDIQAGWRLTVVTPISKSGRYIVQSVNQQRTGNTITLSGGNDLLGYEVAHYAVKGKPKGRVQIEFSSAEITKDGKSEAQPKSIAPLFQFARGGATFLRLIYLTRMSAADHNMAVVAARRFDKLGAITRQVLTNPDDCEIVRNGSCSWIPEGIAVRPEQPKTADGVETWVDAPR